MCQRDLFRFTTDMDRPEHAPDWFGDRGDLIGAYAYAVMKDGATSKVIVYSKGEIDKVRAVSKTSREDSPWNQWYDRMALKTVLHRLAHFVPTSAEYRREQLRAAAEVAQSVNAAPQGNGVPPQAADGQVFEAEVIEEPRLAPREPENPPAAASAAATEHTAAPASERTAPPGKPSKAAADRLAAALAQLPLGDDADRAVLITWLTGHAIDDAMTRADVETVTSFLRDALEHAEGDTELAASRIWEQHQKAMDAAQGAVDGAPGHG